MKKWIFRTFILVLLIGLSIFLFMKHKNKYQYKIEYHDGYTPGNTYQIHIKKNYDIMVIKQPVCEETGCQKESKTKISFQNENKEQIKQFLNERLQNAQKELTLEYNTLSPRDLIIIESIIYNDEVHLQAVDDLRNRLLTFTSSRLDCESVKLEIYDDSTYQYFDSKDRNGEFILSKTGTYSYDVMDIIKNKDQYLENEHGPYLLTNDKNEVFPIYDNNLELNEFLNVIEISLDQCIQITID